MAIAGIESVVFGVADLAEHTRFWSDFGLVLEGEGPDESVFRLPSGSRVILYKHGDAGLDSWSPSRSTMTRAGMLESPRSRKARARC